MEGICVVEEMCVMWKEMQTSLFMHMRIESCTGYPLDWFFVQ